MGNEQSVVQASKDAAAAQVAQNGPPSMGTGLPLGAETDDTSVATAPDSTNPAQAKPKWNPNAPMQFQDSNASPQTTIKASGVVAQKPKWDPKAPMDFGKATPAPTTSHDVAANAFTGVGPTTMSAQPHADADERFHSWLQRVQGDVKAGTDATWVGSALKYLGAKGTDTGYGHIVGDDYTTNGAGDIMAAPLLGVPKAAEGVMEVSKAAFEGNKAAKEGNVTDEQRKQNLQKAIIGGNKVIGGVFQSVGPAGLLVAPEGEALAVVTPAIVAQNFGEKAAAAMGADRDTQEMVGNVFAVAGGHAANAAIQPGLLDRFGVAVNKRTAAEAEYTNSVRNLETARGQAAEMQKRALDAADRETRAAAHQAGVEGSQPTIGSPAETDKARTAANEARKNVGDAQKAVDQAVQNRADAALELEKLHRQITANKANQGTSVLARATKKAVGSLFTLGAAQDFNTAFERASSMPAGKGFAEHRAKIKSVSPDLQAILNENPSVDSIPKYVKAIDDHIQNGERALQASAGATQYDPTPVVSDLEARLDKHLNKFFNDTRGKYGTQDEVDAAKEDIKNRIMQQVGKNPDGSPILRAPNLYESENVRAGLNNEAAPQYRTDAKPTTSAYKAGAFEAAKVMREVIDEAYGERGIDYVKERRAKEAKLIDVRDRLAMSEKKAEDMGNGGLWDSLWKKFGSASTITAIALGTHNPLAFGALAPYLASDRVYQNLKNPTRNIARAAKLADPNAKATELSFRPPTTPEVPPAAGTAPVVSPTTPTIPSPAPVAPPTATIPDTHPSQANPHPQATPEPLPAPHVLAEHAANVAPATMEEPPTNHALNAELATHFNEPLNHDATGQPVTLDDRIDRVKKDTEAALKIGAEPTPKQVKALEAVNEHEAEHTAAIEDAQKKAREKALEVAAELHKMLAQEAAEEKQQKVEEAKKAKTAEPQEGLKTKQAEAKPLEYTDKELPIPKRYSYVTPQGTRYHETGHIIGNHNAGLPSLDIISNQHPDADPKGLAEARADLSSIIDKDGNVNRAKVKSMLSELTIRALSGGIAEEIYGGVPFEGNKTVAGDLEGIRSILSDYGEMSEGEIDRFIDLHKGHTRKLLTAPGMSDIFERYGEKRIAGQHDHYHLNPALTEQLTGELDALRGKNGKQQSNDRQAVLDRTQSGVSQNDTGREGNIRGGPSRGGVESLGETGTKSDQDQVNVQQPLVRNGQEVLPTVEKNVGQENARTEGGRPSVLEGKDTKDVGRTKQRATGLVEKSTGDHDIDAVIRNGGGIPAGHMDMGEFGKIHMFHDPETGSTLGFKPSEKITPQNVGKKLAKSREDFAQGEENNRKRQEAEQAQATAMQTELAKTREQSRADRRHELSVDTEKAFNTKQAAREEEKPKSVSEGLTTQKLVEKYGTTDDRLANGFILSDGRRVAMGAVDHADAVRTVTPKEERSPNRQRDMVDYLNREGVVRTRYRSSDQHGKEVVFSVPEKVSQEQLSEMRQSIGQMGRYGNAVIERADDAGNSAEKEFVRPSDIDSMLREIGAHPEQKGEEALKTKQKQSDVAQAANEFNKEKGRDEIVPGTTHNPELAKRIADAYDKMPHNPDDPAVEKSYDSLKKDIDDQWDYAKDKMGIKFEPWKKEGQPYANSKEMVADVKNNKHLYFFQGGELPEDHPLTEQAGEGLSYNDKLRAVHDLFGHAAHEYQFGPKGEENAWNVHRQMFSPESIPAVTTETRGQNSWVNYGQYLRVPFKEGQTVPEERTTGNATTDAAIKQGGAIPGGFEKGDPDASVPDMAHFHDPTTGSTLVLAADQVTPEAVKQELAKSRQTYLTAKPNESRIPEKGQPGYVPPTERPYAQNKAGLLPEEFHKPNAAADLSTKQKAAEWAPPAGLEKGIAKEDAVSTEIPLSKISVGERAYNGAASNYFRNRGSKTEGPISLVYNPDNGQYLVEDGMHRLVQAHQEGKTIIPAKIWSGHSDIANVAPEQKMDLSPIESEEPDWAEKVTEKPFGGVNPNNPEAPSKKYGFEIAPELRHNPDALTADEAKAYSERPDVKAALAAHPDIKLGWDTTTQGPELNIGASTDNLETAKKIAGKLDQRAVVNTSTGEEIPIGGEGKKTEFPEYPLKDRLADLGTKQKDERSVYNNGGWITASGKEYPFGYGDSSAEHHGDLAEDVGISTAPSNDPDHHVSAALNDGAIRLSIETKSGRPVATNLEVNRLDDSTKSTLRDALPSVMPNKTVRLEWRFPSPGGTEEFNNREEALDGLERSRFSTKQKAEDFEFGNNVQDTEDQQKGIISTAVPGGKNSIADPHTENVHVGMQSLTPEIKVKIADKIRKMPGMRTPENITDPDKVISRYINQFKDNLKDVYNQVPQETRNQTARWYESANKIADKFASKYGKSTKQGAGVLAAMSPQKDWNMNVGLTERLTDIYHQHANEPLTSEARVKAREIGLGGMAAAIGDKTLSQLTEPLEKAAFIRIWDEAHNDRSFQNVDPGTGEYTHVMKNNDGSNSNIAWGGLNEIAKAVNILDDGSRENISRNLGMAHKVRNFYNNIVDPNNPGGHVTIDTHAVAAGHQRPLSGADPEVLGNFGRISALKTGLKGTYAVNAEAYRQAAKELGLQPRQLQSIVWEQIRKDFPAELKSNETHRAAIDDIWSQYKNGKITQKEAQEQTRNYAKTAREQIAANAEKPSTQQDLFPVLPSKFLNTKSPIGQQDFSTKQKAELKDSKVVDEKNEPKVVYHGTTKTFDQYKRGSDGVVFFTDNPDIAHAYAGGSLDKNAPDYEEGANIRPAYLSIKKPLTMTPTEYLHGQTNSGILLADMAKQKRMGYDGWHITPDAELDKLWDGHTWAAFDPKQVKSAFSVPIQPALESGLDKLGGK